MQCSWIHLIVLRYAFIEYSVRFVDFVMWKFWNVVYELRDPEVSFQYCHRIATTGCVRNLLWRIPLQLLATFLEYRSTNSIEFMLIDREWQRERFQSTKQKQNRSSQLVFIYLGITSHFGLRSIVLAKVLEVQMALTVLCLIKDMSLDDGAIERHKAKQTT